MDLKELRDQVVSKPSGLDEDALFSALETGLEQENGLRARVRSLPSVLRTALLLFGSFGVVALVALARPRLDLEHYPMGRMLLFAALTGALTAFTLPLLTRPVHAPPRRSRSWAALVLALAVPVCLAVLPAAHEIGPVTTPAFAQSAFACFAFGTIAGMPALFLAWLVERQDPQPLARALLAAAAAGLVGNMALQAHCPVTTPLHLLVSHALIGAVLIALIWLRRR